jgi:hypothetical protein
MQQKSPSAALIEKLRRADAAIAEYEAQQQIICILLERLGGSVTIGLESMVTKRTGTIYVARDEDTGATTISYSETQVAA